MILKIFLKFFNTTTKGKAFIRSPTWWQQ